MRSTFEPSQFSVSDLIDKERAAGVEFGPWHRWWLLERAPEKVRRNLELAREHRLEYLNMPVQSFTAPNMGFGGIPTAAFNARNTSASELNMLGVDINGTCPQAVLNQYCAIPALDAFAHKMYRVELGGVYGNTGTPTMIFTPRWGSSPTVATNVTLGASATWTSVTGTTGLPYYIMFTVTIRTAPPGATLGTAYGTGIVTLGIPATSSQLAADILIGGTAATVDTTGQGAAGCGITMNLTWGTSSASNTQTCNWWVLLGMN